MNMLQGTLIKRFGGKNFSLSSTHLSRKAANEKVEKLRKENFEVRITKKKRSPDNVTVHQVWRRDKSGILTLLNN